ncbi:hypothetical protein [Brochothrix campestris]|uniref:MapZ extracellular domain-containing protein n=1 Tax=Brochothrix campestris FSL F6-1037 TaxID=1265861 RepID=W7D1X2_9LIST|nr:hypothetical protein [Brochothrix campestris]EUJ41936.1 hypothetical protein BCAMP_00935 [Brochothrix campestris FSL F6-1037]
MPTRADYHEQKKQQAKKRTVKKSVIAIGIFVIALGIYVGSLQYQAQVAAKEERAAKLAEANSTTGRARIAQTAVKSLYVAENSSFLNEDISLEKIKSVQKKVARVHQKDLRTQLNEIVTAVTKMYALQSELNVQFTNPAISGDEVIPSDEIVIAQSTKMKTLVKLNETLADFTNTQWHTEMMTVVGVGMKQARATEQLEETLENETELVSLSERRKNYEEALNLLEQIKNKAIRQTYHIELVKLNKRLVMDEEQERLRIAEEERLAAEESARQVAMDKAASEAAKQAAAEKASSEAAKQAAAEKASSEAAKQAAEKASSEATKNETKEASKPKQ